MDETIGRNEKKKIDARWSNLGHTKFLSRKKARASFFTFYAEKHIKGIFSSFKMPF